MEILKYINEEIAPLNPKSSMLYCDSKALVFMGTVSNIIDIDIRSCDIGSTFIDMSTYCVYVFDGTKFVAISSISRMEELPDGITKFSQ